MTALVGIRTRPCLACGTSPERLACASPGCLRAVWRCACADAIARAATMAAHGGQCTWCYRAAAQQARAVPAPRRRDRRQGRDE